MNGTSDAEILSRLAERVGILDNKTLTQVVALLEQSTRRTHSHVCDQERHLRELEDLARGAHEESRSLAARWSNVWDSVRAAFSMTSAGVRSEMVREHQRCQRLAVVVIRSLSYVIQLDQRLDALEAAAGLPEYISPGSVDGGSAS
jgi:hypothetical protein